MIDNQLLATLLLLLSVFFNVVAIVYYISNRQMAYAQLITCCEFK